MQVRLFSKTLRSGTTDSVAFETEINEWFAEDTDIEILSMTVSSSERDGDISMVFFVVYDEPDDEDSGDELPVTLPQITITGPLSDLIPKLR